MSDRHPTQKRADLKVYIRDVADRMALRDWRVELSDDPCSADAHASSTFTFGKRHCEIAIERDFTERKAEDQRYTVVHELVHAHLNMMHSIVINEVSKYVGKGASLFVEDGFERALEYGVDGLASAIAPLMPLPPTEGEE